MSKFKPGKRSYFQTGVSGYIGAGNRVSVFTRRSKPPFSKLKQIYGDHLEALGNEHLISKDHPKVSPELKERIRESFKKEYRKYIQNQILSIAISVLIFLILCIVVWKVLVHFYPNFN